MEHDAGRTAAAQPPRRGREHRHPDARRAFRPWRSRPRRRHGSLDVRADFRGNRPRRFRTGRQAGAELEGSTAAAQRSAETFAGEMVRAFVERSAISARALPDRTARRLRPLVALQRARGGDADPRRERWQGLGHKRAQAVHFKRLRRGALCRLCTPTRRSGCCRGHPRSSYRARRQV